MGCARLYRSYDAAEKIGLFVDTEEGHGYQIRKREAAYGWFLKWLMGKGDGRPYPEPSTVTLPFDAPELRCFPPGQNQPAGPGIIAAVRRLAKIEIAPIHKEPLPTSRDEARWLSSTIAAKTLRSLTPSLRRSANSDGMSATSI